MLCSLEAAFKTVIVGAWFSRGFDGFENLAEDYRTWSRALFFLATSFFIIETIGPWIGIYYLTGSRARTFSSERAVLRTFAVAVGVTFIATLILMMYLEVTVAAR